MAMSPLSKVAILAAGCLVVAATTDAVLELHGSGHLPLDASGRLLVILAIASVVVVCWSLMRDSIIHAIRTNRATRLLRMFGIESGMRSESDVQDTRVTSEDATILRPIFGSTLDRHPIEPNVRHQG